MKHPSDEFYERCAIEAMKVILPLVDLQAVTKERWAEFVSDTFDLTDAICTELCSRLERNEKFRNEDPTWQSQPAAPASSG